MKETLPGFDSLTEEQRTIVGRYYWKTHEDLDPHSPDYERDLVKLKKRDKLVSYFQTPEDFEPTNFTIAVAYWALVQRKLKGIESDQIPSVDTPFDFDPALMQNVRFHFKDSHLPFFVITAEVRASAQDPWQTLEYGAGTTDPDDMYQAKGQTPDIVRQVAGGPVKKAFRVIGGTDHKPEGETSARAA